MSQIRLPAGQTRAGALVALRNAFERTVPSVRFDRNGYAGSFHENLVGTVQTEDFEADLRQGDGNELGGKFRAVHSSSALAVNCFAPFRRHIDELALLGTSGFERLGFERKCPTGLRRGTPPNLDVVVERRDVVIGIESKLTEYLDRHPVNFSKAYENEIRDERREQEWFHEMLRLTDEPGSYRLLDVAQLIKHAFGLAHSYGGRPVTLLYLFWEPSDADEHAIFTQHREEVAAFADRIAGSTPGFAALSYPELWQSWAEGAPGWLAGHIANLRARYSVRIGRAE